MSDADSTIPDELVNVFLDGFMSGAGSALATVAGSHDHPVVLALASRLVHTMADDPLSREEIRMAIADRLTGRDIPPEDRVKFWRVEV